jgi:hypothetical protein
MAGTMLVRSASFNSTLKIQNSTLPRGGRDSACLSWISYSTLKIQNSTLPRGGEVKGLRFKARKQ